MKDFSPNNEILQNFINLKISYTSIVNIIDTICVYTSFYNITLLSRYNTKGVLLKD